MKVKILKSKKVKFEELRAKMDRDSELYFSEHMCNTSNYTAIAYDGKDIMGAMLLTYFDGVRTLNTEITAIWVRNAPNQSEILEEITFRLSKQSLKDKQVKPTIAIDSELELAHISFFESLGLNVINRRK